MARDRTRAAHADIGAHGVGEDAGGVPDVRGRAGAAGAVGGASGRDAGGVRLAAEGAVERHPTQPVGAAGGDDGAGGRDGDAAAGDPGRGAHGRHHGVGAAGDGATAAAHPHHHAGVAVHPADVGERAEGPRGRAHAHRRRGARRRREQARSAPEPVGGAAVRAGVGAGDTHWAVGDAAAHRGGGALPGGDVGGVGRGWRAGLPGRRDGAPSGDGPGAGDAGGARAGAHRHARAVGRGAGPHRRAGQRAPHDAGLRQHAAAGGAGSHTSCRSGWARRRSQRTTAACRVARDSPSSSG